MFLTNGPQVAQRFVNLLEKKMSKKKGVCVCKIYKRAEVQLNITYLHVALKASRTALLKAAALLDLG